MRYKVTVTHYDGTTETKKLNLPSNYEEAECEAECYFENIKYIDLEKV